MTQQDDVYLWYADRGNGLIRWGEPGDLDRCVDLARPYMDDPLRFAKVIQDDVGGYNSFKVIAAGICVRAADSGRVLLLQRSLDDTDPAQGTWEWPGGCLEDCETPAEAAVREWQEETGVDLPDGEMVTNFICPIGTYETFVWEVPSESDVSLNVGNDGRVHANPDDPDHAETLAWFAVADLPGNPALRDEMQMVPWHSLTSQPIVTNPVEKSLDRYAHIPDDQKNLFGRDGYPDTQVELITLDYFGRPNVKMESGDRLIVERSHG